MHTLSDENLKAQAEQTIDDQAACIITDLQSTAVVVA